jgi:hypothetical protein
MSSFSPETENLVVPDWDQKITFNGLGETTRHFLNAAALKVGYVEEYLKNQGEFATQELRNRMITLYRQAQDSFSKLGTHDGDDIFTEMVHLGIPKQQSPYQDAFFVVMAKYFESCDVFEEPKNKKC